MRRALLLTVLLLSFFALDLAACGQLEPETPLESAPFFQETGGTGTGNPRPENGGTGTGNPRPETPARSLRKVQGRFEGLVEGCQDVSVVVANSRSEVVAEKSLDESCRLDMELEVNEVYFAKLDSPTDSLALSFEKGFSPKKLFLNLSGGPEAVDLGVLKPYAGKAVLKPRIITAQYSAADQNDADADGLADARDDDDDDDGIPDADEADCDNDGIVDDYDLVPCATPDDTDGDGITNTEDDCPFPNRFTELCKANYFLTHPNWDLGGYNSEAFRLRDDFGK